MSDKRLLLPVSWMRVVQVAKDGDVEGTLNAIADYLDIDAEAQDHDGVKAAVESAAELVREAAMDYYASTK